MKEEKNNRTEVAVATPTIEVLELEFGKKVDFVKAATTVASILDFMKSEDVDTVRIGAPVCFIGRLHCGDTDEDALVRIGERVYSSHVVEGRIVTTSNARMLEKANGELFLSTRNNNKYRIEMTDTETIKFYADNMASELWARKINR